ncbi:alpha/beta hydrolase [Ktedonobacteria bacterium brp13]|nr:alpha/beta hydrolase [Ktedonobacteria bacterium brp13]
MSSNIITSFLGSIMRSGRAFTPPIGTPNGIAELKRIELNGYPQWLLIRGQDVSMPVLLFLHGGPGSAEMGVAHVTMKELENHFVCVNWDQRGAGKSFRPGPNPETMTIEQFVKDTIALIELLLARFGQKKVLLVGHSWGSILAMKVAAARPDLLYAVVGMGQIVDAKRCEDLSYQYVLDCARKENNRKAIRALENIGAPPYKKNGLFVQRRWLSHYKGDMHLMGMGRVLSLLLAAREYSIGDIMSFIRGVRFSTGLMLDELMAVNFLHEIPEISIPVFFFAGRYDYVAPAVLVEAFSTTLRAPCKKLIWFEQSAHMVNIEEPEKFQQELIALADEWCSEK